MADSHREHLFLAPILAFALALPAMAPAALAADPAAEREAVRAAELALGQAVTDHDAERFKSLIAPRARLLGATVARGPDEAAKAWMPLLDPESGQSLQWGPKEITVAAAGDLAWSIGEYLHHGQDPDGEPIATTGTYLSVWTKDQSGRWRITADGPLRARDPLAPGFSLERRNAFGAQWPPLAEPGTELAHQRQPTQSLVSASGDLAYSFGEYTLQVTGPTGPTETAAGAYFVVWARQDEGAWQAVAESYLPPTPGAKREPAAMPAASPAAPEHHLTQLRALGNAGREFARSVEIDDVELFKSRVAPDAYFLGSRDTYHGPAEVAAAWAPFLDPESGQELYWEPREVFVAASGELGYTIGDWVEHEPGADGKPVVSTGQYLSIWRQNDEGRWQNTADLTLTVRDPLPAGFGLDRHRAAVSWMAPLVSPAATVSHQRKAWQVGISAAGDFAYAVGNYVDRVTDRAGHKHVAAGRFLTAWRRDDAGAWKVIAEGIRPPRVKEE